MVFVNNNKSYVVKNGRSACSKTLQNYFIFNQCQWIN